MAGFTFDPNRVRFEGKEFIIYDVHDLLPRHKNFPHGTDVVKPNGKRAIPKIWTFREIKDREVDTLYVHQTAGAVTYHGFEAVINTYSFMARDPAYTEEGKWTGRGRGWPSGCYTWYIPYHPIIVDGKVIIFQCWNKDWITWHSSDNYNSVAIVCQGYFRSRHMGKFRPKRGCLDGKPSSNQLFAIEGFIAEYAMGKMGIVRENIKGHCHSKKPKAKCPGDDLEAVVIQVQNDADGVEFTQPGDMFDGVKTKIQLDGWKMRQAALVTLGHDLGPYGPWGNGVDGDPGYMTRMAIETQEELFAYDEPDGYWDDEFDSLVRQLLDEMGVDEDALLELI